MIIGSVIETERNSQRTSEIGKISIRFIVAQRISQCAQAQQQTNQGDGKDQPMTTQEDFYVQNSVSSEDPPYFFLHPTLKMSEYGTEKKSCPKKDSRSDQKKSNCVPEQAKVLMANITHSINCILVSQGKHAFGGRQKHDGKQSKHDGNQCHPQQRKPNKRLVFLCSFGPH